MGLEQVALQPLEGLGTLEQQVSLVQAKVATLQEERR